MAEGHGRAPGPGHALVVHSVGYRVPHDGLTPPENGLALSGEGALACAWLVLNESKARSIVDTLTADQAGTYIRLPIDDEFGMQVLRAIGEP